MLEDIERSGTIVSTEEKRLTLAYEELTQIPQNLLTDYAPIIEILDLSHNQVSNINFLTNFPNLSTLILDHNLITHDTIFPHIPKIMTLWLNHNQIKTLHPFIPQLSSACPKLQCLSVMDNPGAPSYLNGGTYYQYLQYRLFVISWMHDLQYLDDRQVTDDQRKESNRLYGRKIYRTIRNTFANYSYTPTEFLKKFRKIFEKTSSVPSVKFDFGEGVRLEEHQVGGMIPSDSSSSSLSTLFENSPDPNPYRQKGKERNLVI